MQIACAALHTGQLIELTAARSLARSLASSSRPTSAAAGIYLFPLPPVIRYAFPSGCARASAVRRANFRALDTMHAARWIRRLPTVRHSAAGEIPCESRRERRTGLSGLPDLSSDAS